MAGSRFRYILFPDLDLYVAAGWRPSGEVLEYEPTMNDFVVAVVWDRPGAPKPPMSRSDFHSEDFRG